MLYSAMGSGCTSVKRIRDDESDVCTATWPDPQPGRPRSTKCGVYRDCPKPGGFVETADRIGVHRIGDPGRDLHDCWDKLLDAVVPWLQATEAESTPPVGLQETVEIYAFAAAAGKKLLSRFCAH
eukprot:SAG31_NODE_3987_length_3683_cov_4.328962_4_plen_125_part_00